MRIMLITDAWHPQMNGVVRTLDRTVEGLRARGHVVEVIAPSDGYRTMPLPTYPDIKLALFARRDVARRMIAFGPEAVHVATEGPLGQAARGHCLRWAMPFTTSYHTKFPEYIEARLPWLPSQFVLRLTYDFVRNFHNAGGRTMVTTPSMAEFLEARSFANLGVWARGVETDLFRPELRRAGTDEDVYKDLPRPIFVNVGRVAVEKNIEAFLDLDLPGSKVVVGDGPQMAELQKRYPDITFTGAKFGEDLARHFADADVFVFPSRTDTFGLVIIEALATGTPVAAYPVSGPVDIIPREGPGSGAGVLNEDLRTACISALECDRADARRHALRYSWDAATDIFESYLTPEYLPTARKRWRRMRRMGRLAASPLHSLKRGSRRLWRMARGRSVPR